jgi:3-hydroxyisobutyrate dehydrogenase-like beta-hydroxyacid dehydrogenase
MQIGMIGIGRMGGDMVRRLLGKGHACVVYGRNAAAVEPLAEAGAVGTLSYPEFVARLETPRVVWMMVPAAAVEGVVAEIVPCWMLEISSSMAAILTIRMISAEAVPCRPGASAMWMWGPAVGCGDSSGDIAS